MALFFCDIRMRIINLNNFIEKRVKYCVEETFGAVVCHGLLE